MKKRKAKWQTCKHAFPTQYETVREPMFNVGIGSKRVCTLCGAVEFEDWCETRASGGTPRIYPPEKKTNGKKTKKARPSSGS